MEQVFKFTNHTVTYCGGGNYKLKADAGYVLQNTLDGHQAKSVETKDYTQWVAVEAPIEPITRKPKNNQ